MKRNWARIGITLYGVGILFAVPCSVPFFLGAYGRGGVAEYKGRMAALDDAFPPGCNYILFNHGAVTRISKPYYDLIKRTERISLTIYFVAVPFLIIGLLSYGYELTGNWNAHILRLGRFQLWVRLFIPNWNDPFVTLVGKTYLLLVFAALFVFDVTSQQGITEAIFIQRVVYTYAGLFVAALTLSFGLKGIRRRRAAPTRGRTTPVGHVGTARPSAPPLP